VTALTGIDQTFMTYSARVGREFLIILSIICVAQMIGLPDILHWAIIFFCAKKICGHERKNKTEGGKWHI
jgi:hypothetical protein